MHDCLVLVLNDVFFYFHKMTSHVFIVFDHTVKVPVIMDSLRMFQKNSTFL